LRINNNILVPRLRLGTREGQREKMKNEESKFTDDLNTSIIAVVGFIGTIIIFALIIFTQVLFYWTEAKQRVVKDIDQPFLEYANLTADQQAKLAKYQWLDQEKKIVAIPVNRAMELVVDRLSKSQPQGQQSGDGKSPYEKEQNNAQ
jgi:hypothetical protein